MSVTAQPVTRPHVCDSSAPVCPCGRRWGYAITDEQGTRYTSAAVIARYAALYGAHPTAKAVA